MKPFWPISSSNDPGLPQFDETNLPTSRRAASGMTFLQPFILFGLPLALLPVLIHLLNRLRHRPQPWGAMQFLLAASRSSADRARLRQFLILLFRVLAVLALVLFLARPLAGGWLGWAVSSAPDAVLLLVDRSASMEQLSGAVSKREKVLRLMAESAQKFEETSHLILVDSALRQPQALLKAESLLDHPLTKATDAAADIPAMLQSALSWLLENQAGNVEIWIGSDMQSSNWQAEDDRWPSLAGKLRDLPQTVKIRLLAANANLTPSDALISLREQTRQTREGSRQAVFTLDINRSAKNASPLSIERNLDGVSTELPFAAQSLQQRWRHRVSLPSLNASGWGFFSTPPDANNRNNAAYFVYGQRGKPAAVVLSSDPIAGPVLQIAAGNYQTDPPQLASLHSRWNAVSEARQAPTLLIWQKKLPEEKEAKSLETFASQGGVVLFLPPSDLKNARSSANLLAQAGGNHFHGIRWGAIDRNPAFASAGSAESAAKYSFKMGRWDRASGPLADTEEGIRLPLNLLNIRQRSRLDGLHFSSGAGKKTDASVFASFQDDSPLLARTAVGQGAAWFLATLPRPDWSSLADGNVLIPLVQRLLQNSARRQEKALFAVAGESNPAIESIIWNPVVGQENADFRWHAGIYQSETSSKNVRSGELPMWLAVNRSPLEDNSRQLALEEARLLFGELPLSIHQEANEQNAPLQSEAWRLFLLGMLVFLLVEAGLTLPTAKPAASRLQNLTQKGY